MLGDCANCNHMCYAKGKSCVEIDQDKAKLFARYFTQQGFEVKSVCCKNCGINKDVLKLKKVSKDNPVEPMCNPKGQAQYLNEHGAELFVSAGLC